jgi:hypothetical protein
MPQRAVRASIPYALNGRDPAILGGASIGWSLIDAKAGE